MGLIVQPHYILRSSPLEGRFITYYLPCLPSDAQDVRSGPYKSNCPHAYTRPTSTLTCNESKGSVSVFSLIQAGPGVPGQPAILDALALDAWRPTSRTRVTHFVTAAPNVAEYESWQLGIYQWETMPPELSEPLNSPDLLDLNAGASGGANTMAQSTADTMSHPLRATLGPSPPALLARMSIPSVEQLRDVEVHHINHPSLAFLAICPVDLDRYAIEVRAVRRDGSVEANAIEACFGMGWTEKDKILVSPHVGRLVAVVGRSIVIVDL